jgi:hypothetical protein
MRSISGNKRRRRANGRYALEACASTRWPRQPREHWSKGLLWARPSGASVALALWQLLSWRLERLVCVARMTMC